MAANRTTESGKTQRLTRQQRKDLGRRIWSEHPGLEVVHRNAAGIDIGSREHYVAVPPDRDSQPVRVFGCFTTDLHELARWLKECGIQTVVLQSTGVYWIPVYDVLEHAGLDVWLVNARETRNLPGRKSDVQESQWLLKLHTYGLLRKSFRPTAEIRALRTCWRERAEYVQLAGSCIQRMQKALTEMNVQLSAVLSDLSGVTGMRILRAIVALAPGNQDRGVVPGTTSDVWHTGWGAGERDGQRLAEFPDPNVKASQQTIAQSLEGTWLPEQLAILKRQLADWDHLQQQIVACDVDLQAMMKHLPDAGSAPEPPSATPGATPPRKRKNGRRSKNEPGFALGSELKRVTGIDLTHIDGIKVMTVQTIITEAGLDMSKWATEHHFVSWIGFAPRNDVSGGKILKKKTRKVVSRLAAAFRMAATTLRQSDSYLGAQFRRLRTRLGAPKAITAMGAKLARLVYRMLKYGQEYVDKGTTQYEARYREQQIQLLRKKAAQHGFSLVSLATPAGVARFETRYPRERVSGEFRHGT